ncbi:MAG: 4Fe-4S binding protein [Chloroflexota bacterium]
MPKKCIAVDYQRCAPERCEAGICRAVLLCEKKILYQEAPYEMPDTRASMCLGCALCLKACPMDALRML